MGQGVILGQGVRPLVPHGTKGLTPCPSKFEIACKNKRTKIKAQWLYKATELLFFNYLLISGLSVLPTK